MELKEAQLFRFLCELFGKDRIVHGMSVWAICEERLDPQQSQWAQKTKCLFSIVNEDSVAKMVIELFSPKANIVEVAVLERNKKLPEILQTVGIKYVTFSEDELEELIQKESSNSFTVLLQAKLIELEEVI